MYFVNFTNHPSERWPENQRQAAEAFGEIVDVPFPAVEPDQDEAYIMRLADEYEEKILAYQPNVVLCQGEFCLVYQIVSRLKEKGIRVVAACSERVVKEEGNVKTAVFEFRRFRVY